VETNVAIVHRNGKAMQDADVIDRAEADHDDG